MRREAFPKSARLRRRREFELVQGTGRKAVRPNLVALWITSGNGPARLGIAAGRKVGGAVTRNRAKRWIREWFRKTSSTLPAGLQLVVIVRAGAVEAGREALWRDLGAVSSAVARGR